MMPVVQGDRQTRYQIVLYTVVLCLVTVMPLLTRSFGAVYLGGAAVLDRVQDDLVPRLAGSPWTTGIIGTPARRACALEEQRRRTRSAGMSSWKRSPRRGTRHDVRLQVHRRPSDARQSRARPAPPMTMFCIEDRFSHVVRRTVEQQREEREGSRTARWARSSQGARTRRRRDLVSGTRVPLCRLEECDPEGSGPGPGAAHVLHVAMSRSGPAVDRVGARCREPGLRRR